VVHEGVFAWVLATSDGWVGRHQDASSAVLVEVAVAGDRSGTWREWFHIADTEQFVSEEVAGHIADRALLTSNRVLTDSGVNDLIFHPEVAAQLLAAISSLFLARVEEADPLPSLLDHDGRLASPELTIIDDRTDANAPLTGPCDGEGLASRRTVLVDRGVPRHRLASFADAIRCGYPPCGGALRLSYRDYPSTGIANLQVDVTSGVKANQLLLSAHRPVYLLRPMAPVLCDPERDLYRIVASGVWLEGAAVRGWHPVVELSGRLSRLLRRVEAVGTDLRWFQTDAGFVGAPSLLIRRQRVVG
jgi:PmbA protein